MMPKVTFVNEKTEIEIPAGANLRDEARKAGIELHPWIFKYPGLNCMGNGLCATCRVLVKKGMENLSKKTAKERFNLTLHPLSMLSSIGREEEIRLACQVQVNGDCTIETHPPFQGRVLGVEQDPVEAQHAEQFGRDRAAERGPASDLGFALQDRLAKRVRQGLVRRRRCHG